VASTSQHRLHGCHRRRGRSEKPRQITAQSSLGGFRSWESSPPKSTGQRPRRPPGKKALWYPRLALSPSPRSPTADTIRDALGLVRLLYAGRRTREATLPPASDPLVAIGRELHAALELARFDEGSLGHRAALDRASRALGRLAGEVTLGDSASRLARVAQARVSGEKFKVAGRAPPERR
jgi:hypothetical protein